MPKLIYHRILLLSCLLIFSISTIPVQAANNSDQSTTKTDQSSSTQNNETETETESATSSVWADPSFTFGDSSFYAASGRNFNNNTSTFQSYHLGLWKRKKKNVYGISVNRDNTDNDSISFLAGQYSENHQTTGSTNLTGTYYHYFTDTFQISAFMGLADDHNSITQYSVQNGAVADFGKSGFEGGQFTGGAGISYGKTIKKILVTGSGNLSYLNANSNAYVLGSGTSEIDNSQARNQSANTTESLSFTLVSSEHFQPYVSFGLLQILFDRSSLPPSPPTFTEDGEPADLAQHGLNYGGGFNVYYKNYSAVISYQHDKRNHEYGGNTTSIQLVIPFLN